MCVKLAFHHNLRGNPCMIGAWHKHGVVPSHAVVPDQAIHNRLVKGMPHVQGARDVRWRELNRVGGTVGIAFCMLTAGKVASFFPFCIPTGL